MLARSRLKRNLEESHSSFPKPESREKELSSVFRAVKSSYSKHYLLLVLAVISYSSVGYILHNIPPEQIAHVPLPLAYAPLHIPLFLGNLFLFSFIFLHTRRGFLFALFISLVTFLKLQLFLISTTLILSIFALLLVGEVVLTLVNSKRK
jgi:hypothetical protein